MPRLAEAPRTQNRFLALLAIARPWNLLMIVWTMAMVRYKLLPADDIQPEVFTLSILAMVFAAAGGNIINDYFDIREDLINKPRKAFVGRVVKRRWALAAHHILTMAAIACAAGVSGLSRDWRPVAWLAVLITLLWGYSPWFKRKFLSGNLVIAIAVGQLPVWTALSSHHTSSPEILIFAGLSAAVTLIREVTKDLQDRAGDAKAGYGTLAVRWGAPKTQRFLMWGHVAMTMVLGGAARLLWISHEVTWPNLLYICPFVMAGWMLAKGNLEAVSAYQKVALGGGVAVLAWF